MDAFTFAVLTSFMMTAASLTIPWSLDTMKPSKTLEHA